MENDMTTVEDHELMDHSREPLRKATTDTLGESSTSSLQVEASSEDSEDFEVPSITIPNESGHGVVVTNPVEVLNFFCEAISSEEAIPTFGSDKALPAPLICSKVILHASQLARLCGHDRVIVAYLEQVTEYMEKNPGVGSAELRCLLFYACAKVFKKQGCTDKALQSCHSAREVTQLITNELSRRPLEIAISLLLIEINGIQGDPKELITEVIGFLKSHHLYLGWIDLVGFIREIPAALANDPHMTICVMEALFVALRTDHGEKSCAAILFSLSNYYNNTSYPYQHLAPRILVEQAIFGLQQEQCSCRSDHVVYPSAFYGVEECACHQLLADAWYWQGFLQRELGILDGAEQSFQQALNLSQSCKDKDREYWFHSMLLTLMMHKTHFGGIYSLLSFEETPHDSIAQFRSSFRSHFLESLKIAARPEASDLKEVALTSFQLLESLFSKPNSLEFFQDNLVSSVMKLLKTQERRGDFTSHASTHAYLSNVYLQRGQEHVASAREHFFLGLKYWKEGGLDSITVGQLLGQIALSPEIMELDHAYVLWYNVYNWTQEKIENIAACINEEDALHYFETVKHTSMCLAKCEMLKFVSLANSSQGETIVQIYKRNPLEAQEYLLKSLKPLIWAERGKGKMLMSYIGALQKNLDTKVDSGLLEKLNLPSSYPVDFERHFLKDDHFALDFILNRSQTSQKVIFIEYTFIDHKLLMINVTFHLGFDLPLLRVLDLSIAIDKEIQDEAEKELDSLRKPSPSNVEVGSQQLKDPNIARSTSSHKEIGLGAEAANKVLSAMNKYETNRLPFNRWIPGMVAGIQRRVSKIQLLRKRNKSILIQKLDREIRQLLQTLHRVLIKPVEDYILKSTTNTTDVATLVFIPHEDLGIVPFAALHERDGSAFLIEQFAISISPAIWCFRHCEYLYEKKVGSDQAEGPPLLVGRKSGYKPPFEDLVEAHKEVQTICQVIDGSTIRCKKVLDDSTSPHLRFGMKECVKECLPNASWIHFSVHGEISPQFPQGSLLLGNSDDQRLTANEIITSAASSPWRARCVVASACQSGLGSVAGGGIMGFARSFVLAGIPSSVLSMWEVNESFCTSFMEKLYCNLQSRETLGHAVRNTMLCMMKEPVTSVSPSATLKKRRSKRFKEPEAPIQPANSSEPMWSILDWAAFSCFGFPEVKLIADLVVTKPNAKEKSPMDENTHATLLAQHQEDGQHQQEFPPSEELPPQSHLATQQEVQDNPKPLVRSMSDQETANLADGSMDGACFGGFTRTKRFDELIYKLATSYPTQSSSKPNPS